MFFPCKAVFRNIIYTISVRYSEGSTDLWKNENKVIYFRKVFTCVLYEQQWETDSHQPHLRSHHFATSFGFSGKPSSRNIKNTQGNTI